MLRWFRQKHIKVHTDEIITQSEIVVNYIRSGDAFYDGKCYYVPENLKPSSMFEVRAFFSDKDGINKQVYFHPLMEFGR